MGHQHSDERSKEGGSRTSGMFANRCVIVFVRAPVKGKVKTRLAKVLEPREVLELYRCFVADVVEMLASSGIQMVICFHPQGAAQDITAWLGDQYLYLPQQGRDLGERMASAFEYAFKHGCRQALLIGSDIPDLPRKAIHQAFEGIAQSGAVVGPTYDGGYYLIGFERRNFEPAIFDNMPWGTGQVYAETVKRFDYLEKPPLVLPTWRDIDEYEDLVAFAANKPTDEATARHTRTMLRALSLIR